MEVGDCMPRRDAEVKIWIAGRGYRSFADAWMTLAIGGERWLATYPGEDMWS
jgi:hypothetical protein